jgi:structural maintenance of chromosome 1
MDAISFVLGVRATALRSENLQDLIYQQDKEGKGKSRCFVKLVYLRKAGSKRDEEEIHFQRSILYDGKDKKTDKDKYVSEYRINNEVVSWDDYNKRLASFNLIVKARNFLVFQGDVESIVTKSGTELTRMLELISGSDELREDYEETKKNKADAEENTIFNFQKRRGITAEKKQYKEQLKEAERFNKLKDQQAEIQTNHLLFQLFYLNKDIEDTETDLKQKSEELGKLQKKKDSADKQLSEKKKDQAKLHQKSMAEERKTSKKLKELDKAKPALISAQESIAHTTRRIESNRTTVDKLEEERDSQAKKIESLEEDLGEVERQEREFEDEWKQQQKKMKVTLDEDQWREYNRRKEEAAKRTAKPQQELTHIERAQSLDEEALKREEAKMNELSTQLRQLEELRAQLMTRRARVEEVINEANARTKELKSEIDDINGNNQKARTRQEELGELLREVQEELQQVKVHNLETDRENRFRELVATLKRLFPGRVYGRVPDIASANNKAYHKALAVAMGNQLDSIVVHDERTAMECIRYMRDQRVGTATFLPLDTLVTVPVPDRLRNLGGSAKPLIDVLKFDEQFTKVVEYVVGHALVTDTLDEAKKLAYNRRGEKFKVVTLDGTLIYKSGLITGGYAEDVEARATRWEEKKIDEIRKRRDQYLQELSEIGQTLRSFAREEQLRSQQSALESKLKFSKYDLEVTEGKLKKNDEEISELNSAIKKLKPTINKLTAAIDARRADIDRLKDEIHKIEDEQFKDFSKTVGVSNIREYEETRMRLAKERSEKTVFFTTQKSRIQNLLEYERQRDLEGPIERLKEKISEDEKEKKRLQEQEREAGKEVKKHEKELDEINKGYKEVMEQVNELELAVKTLRKEAESLGRAVAAIGRGVVAAETSLDQFRAKRHALYLQSRSIEKGLPIEDGQENMPQEGADPTDPTELKNTLVKEDDIVLKFDELSAGERKLTNAQKREERQNQYLDDLQKIAVELDKIAPNLKAVDRMADVTARLEETEGEFNSAKNKARDALEQFRKIRDERYVVAILNHAIRTKS